MLSRAAERERLREVVLRVLPEQRVPRQDCSWEERLRALLAEEPQLGSLEHRPDSPELPRDCS